MTVGQTTGRWIALALVALVTAIPQAAGAQDGAPVRPDAAALARGWTAVAQGQPATAIETARELLVTDPGNHDAAALAMAAFEAATQPVQGLDAYERWLESARHEDVFLLRPVARSLLREFVAGSDPRLRLAALAALAEAGVAGAQGELEAATAEQGAPIEIEAAMAAAGDAGALNRLETRVRDDEVRDKSSAIDALAQAGARGAAPAIVAALADPAPPTRIAAANALAELGAIEAVPSLQGLLKDPDPAVRYSAEVALARLGQPSNGMTLDRLADSPIADIRLLAARDAALADTSGQGAWPTRVTPLLADPDPTVRLKAARLLLDQGREVGAAAKAVEAALAGASPAARTEGAKLLGRVMAAQGTSADVAALRALLRDPVADVRIQAARALLLATGRQRP